MRKLILFLVRNHTTLLFLVLQVVAFVLIYQSQPYQRSKLFTANAEWSGTVLEQYNIIDNYLNLAKINKNLARENAQLLSASKSSYFELFARRDTVYDTLFAQQYTFLEARVINGSFNKRNNYLTLNKGLVHGLAPDMAVINSTGVVGLVKDVSTHFSTVIPLIHSRNLISVKFLRNEYFGSMSWKGGNHRIAQLSDVPREAPVKEGDTLVTDFRSKSFPANLMIGTVESAEINPENLSYEIVVRLTANFAALDYVYVIDNLLRKEQEVLEAKLEK